MDVRIEDTWKSALSEVFEKGFFIQISDKIQKVKSNSIIYKFPIFATLKF